MVRTTQIYNSTKSQSSSSVSGSMGTESSSSPSIGSSSSSSTGSSTVSLSVSSIVSSSQTMPFDSGYNVITGSPGTRHVRPPPFGTLPPFGSLFSQPPPTGGVHVRPGFEGPQNTPPRVTPQPLTTSSVLSLRQQMDESNHEMVNLLTHQIGTVFNPLIQNTNESYQMLAYQMGRMADFFGTPQPQHQPPLRLNQVSQPMLMPAGSSIPHRQTPTFVANEQPFMGQTYDMPEETHYQQEVTQPQVTLVRRNQDPEEVVRNVQQNNPAGHNNLANLVETILNQNGLNVGRRRPNFVSALSEYVLQTELPRGWKVPKYTKFAGDTSESTVEHIARFLAESGNLANNENLRMKYFPNSLTKNAFTWFTTLPPNSIDTWAQLERLFHEQFYMGQTKISLRELASVKRKSQEPIDDYLNRFRLLKARCFTQVPEHELVEMAAGGLDYSIRKKLDT
ncbi:hypothetical protein A2U01_0000853, partial [Trifolium medium]|nr:hypothetical protein [Trifolium medium]